MESEKRVKVQGGFRFKQETLTELLTLAAKETVRRGVRVSQQTLVEEAVDRYIKELSRHQATPGADL
ncbi:hypothetical protein [Ralstonia pseudosolanacearum]|uniref:hypothetical protein n=1 Tax=Ralstonia pseudosolanacearum TaxID=1310165 RepID=UPI003CF1B059